MGTVVAIAGGVGAAKLLRGLVRIVSPSELTIIGNTGDDVELYGLHISPDLDIVMYTLAGIVDEEKGWGVSGDTFNCLNMLDKLGCETWFKLGDRDLAIHIERNRLLREGFILSEVTAELCKRLKVDARLIPMTNGLVQTKIVSGDQILDFQEYFVKRGTRDEVNEVLFEGVENAKPAPGILDAIKEAERVIVCPSNPILSIFPIISISQIRDSLRKTSAYVVGISPIVGGKALKGPSDRIMASMEVEVSAYGVAKFYEDFLDHFVIDRVDEQQKRRIEDLNIEVTVADTVMSELKDSIRLARVVMNAR